MVTPFLPQRPTTEKAIYAFCKVNKLPQIDTTSFYRIWRQLLFVLTRFKIIDN